MNNQEELNLSKLNYNFLSPPCQYGGGTQCKISDNDDAITVSSNDSDEIQSDNKWPSFPHNMNMQRNMIALQAHSEPTWIPNPKLEVQLLEHPLLQALTYKEIEYYEPPANRLTTLHSFVVPMVITYT
jgi:hypothetical protein